MATYPLSEAYIDGDVLTAANVNSITEGVNDIAFATINAQTGTTYTLVLTDVAKVVTLDNVSAITLTVPPEASVAWPAGTTIVLVALNTGVVTVTAGAGVTINSAGGAVDIGERYGAVTLTKYGTDTWLLIGNLA
jgi:hypothetical protein